MGPKFAFCVCGTDHGINEFLRKLGKVLPFVVHSEAERALGRYQAKLAFKNGTTPEHIEQFVTRVAAEPEVAKVQVGFCSCCEQEVAAL